MSKYGLLLAVILALLLRLFLAFSFEGTGDTGAFCQAGRLLVEGKEVYANPKVFFSAPPFGLHITGLMVYLGRILGLPCHGMWKVPSVIGDMGITVLIYLISRQLWHFDQSKSLKLASLYAFNPIPLLISGYHGQQEGFWLFFILLSWYLIKYHHSLVLSAISASIALAYKLPAVLLIPVLTFSLPTKSWSKRALFVIIISLMFLLSLWPEILTTQRALIRQTFLYSSTPGVWGFGLMKQLGFDIEAIDNYLKIILGLSLSVYFLFKLKADQFDFLQVSLGIIILFLIFTPGFGVQYLLWPLPFLILTRSRYFWSYTLLVSFAFLHTYGLSIGVLDRLLHLLQQKIYFKYNLLYPYALYFPTWLLLVYAALRDFTG